MSGLRSFIILEYAWQTQTQSRARSRELLALLHSNGASGRMETDDKEEGPVRSHMETDDKDDTVPKVST